MVEKHFCDICNAETENTENVEVTVEYGVERKFDVGDECLKTKTLREILKALVDKADYIAIELPDDFLKDKKDAEVSR